MGCKWRQVYGQTTNYYYCTLKEKAVDNHMNCRDCPMKIEDKSTNTQVSDLFSKIFGERI